MNVLCGFVKNMSYGQRISIFIFSVLVLCANLNERYQAEYFELLLNSSKFFKPFLKINTIKL